MTRQAWIRVVGLAAIVATALSTSAPGAEITMLGGIPQPYVVTSFFSSGTTTNIDLSYMATATSKDIGQSFIVSEDATMSAFGLRLQPRPANPNVVGVDAQGASLTLRLYEISGSTFTQKHTETGVLPNNMPYTGGVWLNFALAAPQPLVASQEYGFLLEFDDPRSDNKWLKFEVKMGNLYTTGRGLLRTIPVGGDRTFFDIIPWSGGQDYYFYVRAVPEPASLALLGLGGLLAMRRPRGRPSAAKPPH